MSEDAKTKKCKHCLKEIDALATRCPHCQGKNYVWTTSKKIIAVCLGIFLFMGFSGMFSSSSTNIGTVSSDPQASRKIMATAFAKSIIEDMLKSPSTAKYSNVESYEVSDLKDVWVVSGNVDSQNSYGAMLRNQWEIQFDYRDGKGGTVKSIIFDGKKVQ